MRRFGVASSETVSQKCAVSGRKCLGFDTCVPFLHTKPQLRISKSHVWSLAASRKRFQTIISQLLRA